MVEKSTQHTSDVCAHGLSHTGQVRAHNEDSFRIFQESQLYAVADGLGGHRAGEIASQLAITTIEHELQRPAQSTNDDQPLQQLLYFTNQAHHKIRAQSQNNIDQRGMGTTLVMAMIKKNIAYITNVGDSRAYIVNNAGITQLSQDHTLRQEADMTLHNSAAHRNQLTQALGCNTALTPWTTKHTLHHNDHLLLCTDGLWNMLDEIEIRNIIMSHSNLIDANNALVTRANELGGYDNITVILVKYTDNNAPEELK